MTNSTTYLLHNIKILTYTSMYNISQIQNGTLKFLLYSSRVIGNFNILFLIYGTWMHLRDIGFDEFASSVMVYFYLCITALFRSNYFYFHDHITESIVKKLNEVFIYTTRTGLEEKDMKRHVSFTNKYVPLYVLYILVFGVAYHFIPVVTAFISSGERHLPIPIYCPYDCKASPLFELTVFIQTIVQLEIVFSVMAPDLFYWSLMYMMSRQFEMLGWELKNSLYAVLLDNGFEKNLVLNFREHLHNEITIPSHNEIYEVINTEKFTTTYIKKFSELIRFHESLVQLCEDVNNLFSPVLLAWCILIIFLIMICGFLFLVTNDVVILTTGLTHCLTLAFTLLCTCIVTELVKTRSEELRDILYGLEWYICRREFKKVVLIMMMQVTKPVRFTVGKFADLNLSVFVWTMRTTFSYFTVMRQVVGMKH